MLCEYVLRTQPLRRQTGTACRTPICRPISMSACLCSIGKILRAIDRLLRVADEQKTFGVSNFIKMGLRRVDLFPDQAGSLSADLARRVEHVLRSAMADLQSDKRPPIIPHEGSSPGEWPGIRLQIGLISPPLSVNEPVRVQIEFRSMFDE
jgi:hypothetical protein